jgi:tryptophanyl-tRNA synthetase
MIPGIDGRKMSKSYHNDIAMSATPDEIWQKVRMMITDPARIHKNDPGHPEVCLVHSYHEIFYDEELEETRSSCREGSIGCVACKKRLATKINSVLEPVRERRASWAAKPRLVDEILAEGTARARNMAGRTMHKVREAMGI